MRKQTKEEFISRARSIHGDRYDYSLVEYTNMNTKITIVCSTHGPFQQEPSNHIFRRKGCKLCGYVTHGLTFLNTKKKTFEERSKKIHSRKYGYSLVNYRGNNIRVDIICPFHGEFKQTPHDHLEGCGCPLCNIAGKKRLTTEQFIESAKRIHGNRYDYSEAEYILSNEKIKILCKIHGKFFQRANDHISGRGCPNCIISKGEEKIKAFLQRYNIPYIPEYKINNRYFFDFYLPDHVMFIEYDGAQHYKYIQWFHRSLNNFESYRERDVMKSEYAEKNNMELLRIPYWEYANIDGILGKELMV